MVLTNLTSSTVDPIQLSRAEDTVLVAWVVTSDADSKLASDLLHQARFTAKERRYKVPSVSCQLQVRCGDSCCGVGLTA